MPSSNTTAAPLRTTILHRAVRQSFLLATIIVCLLTVISLLMARSLIERRALSQASSLAAIGEDVLSRALDGARRRASLLAGGPEAASAARGEVGAEAMGRWLSRLREEDEGLVSVAVLDRAGRPIAVAGPAAPAPPDARASLVPRVSKRGWEWFDVYVPVGDAGILALRYSASAAIGPIEAAAPSLGRTADVLLGMRQGDDLLLLQHGATREESFGLTLGPVREQERFALPLALALRGDEGAGIAEDHRGHRVLTAWRSLPALGWSLAVQVDRDEVMEGVRSLALALFAVGGALLALAAVLAVLLARSLTGPLRALTGKVERLRPEHWDLRPSVGSGDEVELLDRVVVDLAARLKVLYEHLEEEVRSRTDELAKQYALDRAVLQGIDAGVLSVDKEGMIRQANAAALRLTGAEGLVGRPVAEALDIRSHRQTSSGLHPVLQCLKSRKPVRSSHSMHAAILRADQALLPVTFTATPLLVGRILQGAILVFQDVTEERQVDYMKSEFISLASHQLRTPLSALRWYLELFSEEAEAMPDEKKEYLTEMRTSVERMVNLLNALLHSAKLEERGIEPEARTVDLSQVVRDMAVELRELSRAAGLRAEVSIPAKKLSLETDVTLLSIVLQNLVSNAVKYTPRGGKVELRLAAHGKGAEIRVTDTGIGIPAGEQERVFQKFFRAKNVRTLDTDGNGLGLHISLTIIEKLGGSLTFKSAEGKGATFVIRLPAHLKRKRRA